MELIKLDIDAPTARGVFTFKADKNSIPGNAIDFALCQICRLSNNNMIVNNPTADLGWDTGPGGADAIKVATLDTRNGWFMDNLYRGDNSGQNCIYYMDSFIESTLKTFLDNIYLDVKGGTLFDSGGAAAGSAVTKQAIQKLIKDQPVVAIGKQNNEQPFLQDVPAISAQERLDFRVYLMYRTGTEQKSEFRTVGGFTWSFLGNNHTVQVGGFIKEWGELIQGIMNKAVAFQKDRMGKNWSYR